MNQKIILSMSLFLCGLSAHAKHVELDSSVVSHEEEVADDLSALFSEETSGLDAVSTMTCKKIKHEDPTLLQQLKVGAAFLWNEPTLCFELAVGQVKDVLGIDS